ncbi:G-protein coupled receptor 183-like [Anneissia japonica]|uniref:G-protein coupled receptor 183-like n=1 Tax=Anneissia japonica TaxID=1529436 RepID=UPI001425AC96|nr:G-protein coupled receptor 183-like [Anneissia japonica]
MVVPTNGSDHIELQDPLVLFLARWVFAGTGIVANSIVMLVFIYNKTYKKSLSLKLLLHQTVIDLIGSVMFLIFYNIDVPDGTGGTIFCKTETLFFYVFVTSTYNFVLLTVERYIAIVHPLLYRQKSFGRKVTYISLICPHVSGLLITVNLPIYAEKNPNGQICSYERFNAIVGIIFSIVDWLIPICIMLYCYVQMLLKLHKTRIVNDNLSTEFQPRNDRQNRVKRNLIKTLIIIAFVYFVTVTPSTVSFLVYFISDSYDYTLNEVVILLLDLNLTINPFIYCMVYKDFQRGIHKIRNDIFHG